MPLVPKETSYDSVVMLIRQFPEVLVEDGLGKIVGYHHRGGSGWAYINASTTHDLTLRKMIRWYDS